MWTHHGPGGSTLESLIKVLDSSFVNGKKNIIERRDFNKNDQASSQRKLIISAIGEYSLHP